MSFEPEDLAQSINQWSMHMEQQQQRLEAEVGRIKIFQRDYDALEKQLQTLPDETVRPAMIPIGSLAFMPGKLIHTNEITVYLGSDYYVERSAKQALEILNRRREVVNENLRLVEAQLNGLTTKKETGYGVFSSNELGVDEDGLPIMEIREELPVEEPAQKSDKSVPAIQEVVSEKPLKEDKAPTPNVWEDKEYKDMMAMLQRLEEEEEEEMAKSAMQDNAIELKQEDSDENEDKDEDESDDDDDYMDDRYDTEIADNLFDQFDDDEEYATQGIVEYEDATVYEVEDSEQVETDIVKEDVIESEIPVVQGVKETQSKTTATTTKSTAIEFNNTKSEARDIPSTPKKVSRFKAERDQGRQGAQQTTGDLPLTPVVQEIPSVPTIVESVAESNLQVPTVKPATPLKKVSRFKAARQQEKDTTKGLPEAATIAKTSTNHSSSAIAKDRAVQDKASTAELKSQIPLVETSTLQKKDSEFKPAHQQEQTTSSDSSRRIPTVVTAVPEKVPATVKQTTHKNNQEEVDASPRIPTVKAAIPGKKLSRFKAARVQERSIVGGDDQIASPIEIKPDETPLDNQKVQNESVPLSSSSEEKGKRRVTWDEVATVQEHDRFAAPSDVSSDAYVAPVKQGEKIYKAPQTVKSPADIFNLVQAQRQTLMDDGYPSLETGEDDFEVDMEDLSRSAHLGKQELWQSKDESEPPFFIREVKEANESNLPVIPKTKLDTNVMRGAVMEREIEPVDLDEVEMDMDFREVTTSYHKKRYNFVAAMGGFTFDPKETFEVVDEELPLPSKGKMKKEDEVPEEKPKKVSRFKAARIAAFEKEQ